MLSFDAIASQFDDQRGLPADALRRLVEFVGRMVPGEPLRIVEPGIGTGRISLPLAAAGHSVTGVDISQEMLDACVRKARALGVAHFVTLERGAANDIPAPDAAFDVGIFASLLYLVQDWESVLDELARVVRPGGVVIHVVERTEPGEDLARWDAAWRERINQAGAVHASFSPTDAEVDEAMRRRWPDVAVESLASWGFGQTVTFAREGYSERLRALYPSLDGAVWDATVNDFLAWSEMTFPNPDTVLAGTVALEMLTAWT